jgi:hypothetical protein
VGNTARALHEERDGRVLQRLLGRRHVVGIRQRERGHNELLLGAQAQAAAAGHQQREGGAGGEQVRQCWRGGGHLLEVVEHEQQALLPQARLQDRAQRPLAGVAYPQRLGERCEDEGGIVDGGEADEDDAIGERIGHPCRHLQRQARLADARGATEREQPHVGPPQQVTDRRLLVLAAEQRRRGEGRQARRTPFLPRWWGLPARRACGGVEGGARLRCGREGVGEQGEGVLMRRARHAQLQIADGAHPQPGARRQLLLCQPSHPAVTPQERGEDRLVGRHTHGLPFPALSCPCGRALPSEVGALAQAASRAYQPTNNSSTGSL